MRLWLRQLTVTNKTCYFCGLGKHVRHVQCPAREQTCNKCHKKGHYARVCRFKTASSSATYSTDQNSDGISRTNTEYAPSLVAFESLRNSTVEINLNGTKWKALVDSGNEESFIHPKVVKTAKLKMNSDGKKITMAASSVSVETLGTCQVSFMIGTQAYNGVVMSVLADLCADLILGRDFQSLHESINFHYGGTEPSLSVCGLTTIDIEPPELFANLTEDCHPIATKSRKNSLDDRKFIDSEIKKLLQEGIIENSNSPWRPQVLVTRNENHRKRLVIDYSATINKFSLLDAYPLPKINDLVNNIAQYKVFSTVDLASSYHQVKIKESDKKYTAFEANGFFYQFTRIHFGVTNGVACFQRTIDTLIKEDQLEGVFPYLDYVTICGKNQAEHDKNFEHFMKMVAKRGLTCNRNKCVFSTRKLKILGSVIENGKIKPDPERLCPLLEMPLLKGKKSLQRAMGFFSYYSHWIPRFSGKLKPLLNSSVFPLNDDAEAAFSQLKNDIAKSAIILIRGVSELRIRIRIRGYPHEF